METNGLREELRERLSILLEMPLESIDDTASLADAGVDSMMRLELVALVEVRVGFELPEQDLEGLISVDQIVSYVANLESA